MIQKNAACAARKPLMAKDLPQRSRAVVVGLDTDAATAERLAAIGLGIGASITVVQTGDRLVVQVGESRIGLGAELGAAVRAVLVPGSPMGVRGEAPR